MRKREIVYLNSEGSRWSI